jgi:pyruvate dehydrogenase E2 component (dihydrolipoamide acetyltransferase)
MLEIHVPQLGEGLREVRVVELLRRTGDEIRRGDAIYIIETDKTTFEMESPHDGRIVSWRVAPGDVIPIGAAVAVLGEDALERRAELKVDDNRRLIPPRTRAYAKSKGISDETLKKIPSATEKLLPSDIDAHLVTPALATAQAGFREYRISGAHRTLVYRLRRSANLVIPGTISSELPWPRLSERSAASPGDLRATPFQVLCHAVALTARDYPRLRSVIIGDDTIREYDQVNIGIALARPNDELITAVVRDADRMTLGDFVRACTRQMRSALRDGDQSSDDTQILMSHIGEYDVVDAVPTLVAPASSVLFLASPPVGSSIARICMTFDHRVLNGASAATFIQAVIKYLMD